MQYYMIVHVFYHLRTHVRTEAEVPCLRELVVPLH